MTVDIISEFDLIYRSRIVEKTNISIHVIFLTVLIHDTDLLLQLILSYRSVMKYDTFQIWFSNYFF